MVWFKVDDSLPFHAKVVQAGNPAMGLWVRAGAWSAQQLTDGFVPDHIVTTLGTRAQAKRLTDVGLWRRTHRDGAAGYEFHQWNEDGRQPTRESVEKERSEARERMRKAREAKRSAAVGSPEVRANTGRSSGDVRSTRPDPARPGPTRPLEEDNFEGGSHVSSGSFAAPPRFPDHCPDHADVAVPPKCGGCAKQKQANKAAAGALPDYRLRVVPPLCGECDERWIETPGGLVKCPRCYPKEMAS